MKLKRIIIPLALLVASPVLAQTATSTRPTPAINLKGQAKVEMEKQRAEMEAKRAELKAQYDAERQNIKDEMENKRAELKAQVDARKFEMKENAEELKAKLDAVKMERKERFEDVKEDIARGMVERTGNLLTATVERLMDIIERLESRISKVKAGGVDTTESENYVAAAKQNLVDARADIAALKAMIADLASSTGSSTPVRETIRDAAKKAKDDIKAAHENLKKATRTVMGYKPGPKATSTPATTTSTTN